MWARLPFAVWKRQPAEKYKPALQRKGNEADRQENDKSTSHVTAFPVNNNTCV